VSGQHHDVSGSSPDTGNWAIRGKRSFVKENGELSGI